MFLCVAKLVFKVIKADEFSGFHCLQAQRAFNGMETPEHQVKYVQRLQ